MSGIDLFKGTCLKGTGGNNSEGKNVQRAKDGPEGQNTRMSRGPRIPEGQGVQEGPESG